jgi:hypothetical protein
MKRFKVQTTDLISIGLKAIYVAGALTASFAAVFLCEYDRISFLSLVLLGMFFLIPCIGILCATRRSSFKLMALWLMALSTIVYFVALALIGVEIIQSPRANFRLFFLFAVGIHLLNFAILTALGLVWAIKRFS